jgi:hypothetical protein
VFIRSVSLVALYDWLYLLLWSVLSWSFHSDTCLTSTDTGIKRIVNQMGSEDLCSGETDRTGPKDTETLTDGLGGSLERLKTKNKTTKTGESRCLKNSPKNNCRC